MRKTLMATTLALAMALTAVSGFAATPAAQPQIATPNLSPVVQPRLVSEYLADTIFLAAPGVAPAPVSAVFRGVCNISCQECYGSCPRDPDSGLRQTCTFACN
ncbi:MAG TPA: hypothetical protein VGQ28_15290 [Thermoanaerobaculia bacterium]|jgi:hypothetical protein|nr:hypothetical protein [Thermoanaerobaculia bacterium]